MAQRPRILLAPHFRTLEEIFDPHDLARLHAFAEVVWAKDAPLPEAELEALLPEVWAWVGTHHPLPAERLARAPKLRAVIDVAGGFPTTIDYDSCFARGIRLLSGAPAFGEQVAEMALAMALAGGRGLVREHEAMRRGDERWMHDAVGWDFSLQRAAVGLIGFGSLARNLLPLLKPFGGTVRVFDPWLPAAQIAAQGCVPAGLDEVIERSRALFVLAIPTPENRGLLSRERLAQMPQGALLLLMSRAHLVDFDALTEALVAGRIQAAIDVFPEEPLPRDHPIRRAPNVILSAHRAASILRERRSIGRMVVDDLELMARGLPPTQLQRAEPELIALRQGTSGNAAPGRERG
jgi:phosphoglycerate dehydrogenase-like enzyme